MDGVWRPAADGIVVFVRVVPNGGADRVEGLVRRDDGRAELRLRVAAAPEKGRASASAVTLLAAALGVPKSAVRIVSGSTARSKQLHVAGDSAALAAALEALGPG